MFLQRQWIVCFLGGGAGIPLWRSSGKTRVRQNWLTSMLPLSPYYLIGAQALLRYTSISYPAFPRNLPSSGGGECKKGPRECDLPEEVEWVISSLAVLANRALACWTCSRSSSSSSSSDSYSSSGTTHRQAGGRTNRIRA